jgi:hypothetical protein
MISSKQASKQARNQANHMSCWLFAALGELFVLVELVALVLVACQTRAN